MFQRAHCAQASRPHISVSTRRAHRMAQRSSLAAPLTLSSLYPLLQALSTQTTPSLPPAAAPSGEFQDPTPAQRTHHACLRFSPPLDDSVRRDDCTIASYSQSSHRHTSQGVPTESHIDSLYSILTTRTTRALSPTPHTTHLLPPPLDRSRRHKPEERFAFSSTPHCTLLHPAHTALRHLSGSLHLSHTSLSLLSRTSSTSECVVW